MTACTEQALLLQGFIDGELDAANSLACEAHVRICAACAAELERLQALRAVLSAPGVRFTRPPETQARLLAALDALVTSDARPSSRGSPSAAPSRHPGAARPLAWAGGSLMALAAGFALALLVWVPSRNLQEELVASHVRSLLAGHLVDVATSDRHVVKPWFNGKLDFAPPVLDLADQGFPLSGGRLDYVQGRVVAALVYRRRQHTINLFIWPSAAGSLESTLGSGRTGYRLEHWSQAGLTYWAVSDTDARELAAFHAAFAGRERG